MNAKLPPNFYSGVGGSGQRLHDDPRRVPDMPYVRALDQKPKVIAGNTYIINTQTETQICRIQLEEPALVVGYVAIDLLKNEILQQTGGVPPFMVDQAGNELFMLGRIRMGCQGTYLDANFDIPIGGIIQIPVMAESVEINARFCGRTDAYAVEGTFAPHTTTYWLAVDPPPLGTAPTTSLPDTTVPVQVSGFIGQKGPSTGTATRRFRITLTNSQAPHAWAYQVPVPNLATHFRFLGDATHITASWVLAQSTSGLLTFPLTSADDWIPIPLGMQFLQLACDSTQPVLLVEVQYKIGFDGLGT